MDNVQFSCRNCGRRRQPAWMCVLLVNEAGFRYAVNCSICYRLAVCRLPDDHPGFAEMLMTEEVTMAWCDDDIDLSGLMDVRAKYEAML